MYRCFLQTLPSRSESDINNIFKRCTFEACWVTWGDPFPQPFSHEFWNGTCSSSRLALHWLTRRTCPTSCWVNISRLFRLVASPFCSNKSSSDWSNQTWLVILTASSDLFANRSSPIPQFLNIRFKSSSEVDRSKSHPSCVNQILFKIVETSCFVKSTH